MSIPNNRFTIQDNEFDIPTNKYNTVPSITAVKLATSTPEDTEVTAAPFKASKRIKVQKTDSVFLGDLPVTKGETDVKLVSNILNDVGKSAITGQPIASVLTGTAGTALLPELKKAYDVANDHTPPSMLGNKVRVRPNNELGCNVDLDNLLRALGLNNSLNGIGLLALLNKLICAGISNALSLILDGIETDLGTKKLLADKTLLRAAKKGDFATIIDVSRTSTGELLSSDGTNTNYSALSALREDSSFTGEQVDDAIRGMDSSWGTGGYGSISNVNKSSRDSYVSILLKESRSKPTSLGPIGLSTSNKNMVSVQNSGSVINMSTMTRSLLAI